MTNADDNQLCRYMVLITTNVGANGHPRPVFVMAKDAGQARTEALSKLRYLDNVPDLRVQLFILGASEVAPVMPQLKEVAWFYFCEGCFHSSARTIKEEDMSELRAVFEAQWSRHGVETEPAV